MLDGQSSLDPEYTSIRIVLRFHYLFSMMMPHSHVYYIYVMLLEMSRNTIVFNYIIVSFSKQKLRGNNNTYEYG